MKVDIFESVDKKKYLLRQGNGYKVWHYTGSLMHEKAFSAPDELWEADWQTTLSHPTFKISKQAVQGIAPSQPQVLFVPGLGSRQIF